MNACGLLFTFITHHKSRVYFSNLQIFAPLSLTSLCERLLLLHFAGILICQKTNAKLLCALLLTFQLFKYQLWNAAKFI